MGNGVAVADEEEEEEEADGGYFLTEEEDDLGVDESRGRSKEPPAAFGWTEEGDGEEKVEQEEEVEEEGCAC
jgi:hypothetical protein